MDFMKINPNKYQNIPSNDLITSPELSHRGGAVLKDPKVYNLYIGSFWNSPGGYKERQYIDNFSKFIGQSTYNKSWTEYGGGKLKYTGSSVIANSTSKKIWNESDIVQQISSQLSSELKRTYAPQTIYNVVLPPNAVLKSQDGSSSLEGLGGYHGSFDKPGLGRVYYSAVVHADGMNGPAFKDRAVDNMTVIESHELTEAITDPDVNNGKLGWYNDRYGEVGDIPIALGLHGDQLVKKVGKYWVQKEWSNKDNKVV